MSSKYQVFVSSTFKDLESERNLVIKAVLEMGHIPVGMEMFSAADEEQWNIIKKQIDQSDYYMVVVAHRYGSCDASGVSYTEKEYDYALSKGIPCLGFVLEDGIQWSKDKADSDRTTLKKLKSFKEKIKLKPVSFWKNGEDLYGRCSIALMKAFNAYPREGWVRASQIQDATVSKEIVRLSAENADLRARLQIFETNALKASTIQRAIETMRVNKRKISVWEKNASDWGPPKEVTLYQIFETLAMEMQVELSLSEIAQYTATNILGMTSSVIRPTWATPRNTIRSILADLSALKCVAPSTRRKPVADKNEYWSLTEYGSNVLAEMRRRRLNRVERLAKIEEPPSSDKISDI